jgi:hypothetical protein
MESNHLPSGYEPPALTDELHPHNMPVAYYVAANEVSIENNSTLRASYIELTETSI